MSFVPIPCLRWTSRLKEKKSKRARPPRSPNVGLKRAPPLLVPKSIFYLFTSRWMHDLSVIPKNHPHHHPYFVPLSSLYCFKNANSLMISSSLRKDGKFDAIKHIKRRRQTARRRRRKRRHAISSVNLVNNIAGSGDDSDASHEPKKRCITNKHSRLDASGVFQRIYPHTSTWYFLYVGNELIHHDVELQSQFRNRFRMTYNAYSELVQMCKCSDIFSAWRRKKNNHRGSIIELLLLGSLRYLGRGWTFDDIEESTAISADTHR